MTALPWIVLALLTSAAGSSPLPSSPKNATTTDPLQVVCAWPISGQYGPGSRVLCYILIATCIIARKMRWLVNPCLAIALLPPATAAMHSIVLAAVYTKDAVDMDIFGAFQLCAIGILAAPVTVMLSRTLFNDPVRKLILLWMLLILSGLVSLTIVFYRTDTHPCPSLPRDPSQFPYGRYTKICGLECLPDTTKSPARGGAGDNVYIIPAPQTLTFSTGILLSAGCCLHTILCLVLMWTKTLEKNWKRMWGWGSLTQGQQISGSGDDEGEESLHLPIPGTNSATRASMNIVNQRIGGFLSIVATLVFGGAGVALLIIGEINFFSKPVNYQTEPMASIGQWSPVVGAGMAILGSTYLVAVQAADETKDSASTTGKGTSAPSHAHQPTLQVRATDPLPQPRSSTEAGHHGHAAVDHIESVASPGLKVRNGVAAFLGRVGHALGDPSLGFIGDSAPRPPPTFPLTPTEQVAQDQLHAVTVRENEGSVSRAPSLNRPPSVLLRPRSSSGS